MVPIQISDWGDAILLGSEREVKSPDPITFSEKLAAFINRPSVRRPIEYEEWMDARAI